jgi:hypothetical protein
MAVLVEPESEVEDVGEAGIGVPDGVVEERGLLLEVSYIMPIESSFSSPFTSVKDDCSSLR